MNRNHKYTNERSLTPFIRSVFQIPAWIIVCNAAGPLTEEYPNDS